VKRALITGASGFTGRYLAPLLAEAGYEVHGTVQGDTREAIDGISKLHAVDIADAESVTRTVEAVAPDKVVHLAAIAFVAHANLDEMYRTNVVGTRNLLGALANAPKPPAAVLLASSANIYGNAASGVLDENVPPDPANDYAVTKIATEYLASMFGKRLPLIVVRPFNYTGRGQSTDFLVAKIVDQARRRASVIELGNLDVSRDFSDVRGVVDAYARLLEQPEAIGGTFNVCSGKATALQEILTLVRQISGHEMEVQVNPAFSRPDEVRSLCGSPARVEKAIGPLRMPPLEETLRWMLEN
jgi:GDP-6-deoxy-D-talose 4-dehydrogenase